MHCYYKVIRPILGHSSVEIFDADNCFFAFIAVHETKDCNMQMRITSIGTRAMKSGKADLVEIEI